MFWILLSIYLGLNLADYLLTVEGLRLGAKEANPLFRNASPLTMGIFKLLLVAITIICSILLYIDFPVKWAYIMVTLGNIYYTIIVVLNIRTVRRIRQSKSEQQNLFE